MKRIFLIIIFILILTGCAQKQQISRVCIDGNCFEAEIADSKEEREQGLMHRESLDLDKGMLFIYKTEDIYPFWMKNTLIPLDMIWISEDLKVVSIFQNAEPCEKDPCPTIKPLKRAKYILEVNGGVVVEKGIETGDVVRFEY